MPRGLGISPPSRGIVLIETTLEAEPRPTSIAGRGSQDRDQLSCFITSRCRRRTNAL